MIRPAIIGATKPSLKSGLGLGVGGFSPGSLSGLLWWLDFTDEANGTVTGGKVKSWTTREGSYTGTWSPPTASDEPDYSGGQISFHDGSAGSWKLQNDTDWALVVRPMTVIYVGTAVGQGNYCFALEDSLANLCFAGRKLGTWGAGTSSFGLTGISSTRTYTLADGRYVLGCTYQADATTKLHRDGVAEDPAGSIGSNATVSATVGNHTTASIPWRGDMEHLLFYEGELSDDDHENLTTYFL